MKSNYQKKKRNYLKYIKDNVRIVKFRRGCHLTGTAGSDVNQEDAQGGEQRSPRPQASGVEGMPPCSDPTERQAHTTGVQMPCAVALRAVTAHRDEAAQMTEMSVLGLELGVEVTLRAGWCALRPVLGMETAISIHGLHRAFSLCL